MNKKDIAIKAVEILKKEYPDAKCSLNAKEPLHLLIATRLAAQCTDARVNLVTPKLFERYKTVYDFANADVQDIENYIRPCGLYKTKAKDIIVMCQKLIKDFDTTVPDEIEKLTTLPGVGRKTANLIVGDIFGKPSYVVDTHCIRITGRLGFHEPNLKDATKIEKILRKIIPPEESGAFCHRLVMHGRKICTARKPKCQECCLNEICKFKN